MGSDGNFSGAIVIAIETASTVTTAASESVIRESVFAEVAANIAVCTKKTNFCTFDAISINILSFPPAGLAKTVSVWLPKC